VCLLPPTYSRQWYEDNMEHSDITSEIEEHLKAYGIMSGFCWTSAQASYEGFYMDNDVTRPFCSNVVVFDGDFLSFFSYQLNTLAIDKENIEENCKNNLCFGKTSVNLFESNADGKKQFNLEALKTLYKIMMQNYCDIEKYESDEVNKYESSLNLQVSETNNELENEKPLHVKELEEKVKQLQLLKEKNEQEKWDSLPIQKKMMTYSIPKKIATYARNIKQKVM